MSSCVCDPLRYVSMQTEFFSSHTLPSERSHYQQQQQSHDSEGGRRAEIGGEKKYGLQSLPCIDPPKEGKRCLLYYVVV